MEKTCLWCLNDETETSFDKAAHILPRSLGATEICEFECDRCNEFFGQTESPKKPSIDAVIKETLILSKYLKISSLLTVQEKIGSKEVRRIFGKSISENEIRKLGKSTSFFKIKMKDEERSIKPKNTFNYHVNNPIKITNYLKRGLYKAGFEKAFNEGILPKKYGSFQDKFYNYIRDFVRWDKGNPKLIYLQRRVGAEYTTIDYSLIPKVSLYEIDNNYLKFDILGHVFAISLGKSNLTEPIFFNKYSTDKIFIPIEVRTFLDIDIFNKVFRSRSGYK